MNRCRRAVVLIFVVILFSTSIFADESITISTYYPSPAGNYNQLTTTGATYLATTSSNVGIGTTGPAAKLEINGNLKFTGDTNVMSRAPRVIHTEDAVAGCPPVRAAWTALISQSFTLTRSAFVYIDASITRRATGRVDLYLSVDGSTLDITLDFTPAAPESAQPLDDNVHWAGTLAAGSHTVVLSGNTANVWGCGSTQGAIDTIIFES